MTAEQIDAMEAGPEMDAAVGEACDFESGIVNGECLRGTDDFPEMVAFRPSTDWNDAMFAAERFGLFDCEVGHEGSLYKNSEIWAVDRVVGAIQVLVATAPTGPLAICRAILKLHGGER